MTVTLDKAPVYTPRSHADFAAVLAMEVASGHDDTQWHSVSVPGAYGATSVITYLNGAELTISQFATAPDRVIIAATVDLDGALRTLTVEPVRLGTVDVSELAETIISALDDHAARCGW